MASRRSRCLHSPLRKGWQSTKHARIVDGCRAWWARGERRAGRSLCCNFMPCRLIARPTTPRTTGRQKAHGRPLGRSAAQWLTRTDATHSLSWRSELKFIGGGCVTGSIDGQSKRFAGRPTWSSRRIVWPSSSMDVSGTNARITSIMPATNRGFWEQKFAANVARADRQTDELLSALGWAVVRIWEHEDVTVAATRIVSVVTAARAAHVRR